MAAARPSLTQRRVLERLASGAVVRMPPWARRSQLVAAGEQGEHLADATLRVLLRHGWVKRETGPASQVPTYHLSRVGRQALAAEDTP